LQTWTVALRFAEARGLQPKKKALRQSPLHSGNRTQGSFLLRWPACYLIVVIPLPD
jgi:hypothetical protein